MILERRRRLRESVIWELNSRYYAGVGPAAWVRTHTIPDYPTTNAFTARAQARVAMRFLCEVGRPTTFLELGAGTGVFAFRFLSHLAEMARHRGAELAPYRYVLTDVAEKNVDFCRRHPRLAQLAHSGCLSFATFDAADPGAPVPPDPQRAPALVVLANYVFDTLPCDAFAVRGGRLHEVLLTTAADVPDPIPEDLVLTWEEAPASLPYYGDDALDGLLEEYGRELGDTGFLLPVSAWRCIDRLTSAAGGPVLVLAADKGYCSIDEIARLGDPPMARHGSVSVMVNFHALGRLVAGRGGTAHATSPRDVGSEEAPLAHVAFVTGGELPGVAQAFGENMEQFGPGDFTDLQVLGALEPRDTSSLSELLALLRLSAWDSTVFLRMSTRLAELTSGLPRESSLAVRKALRAVMEGFYPLDAEEDACFAAAVILHGMAEYGDALAAFASSERFFGKSADLAHNMGLCHFALGDPEAALGCFEAALRLDPDYGPSREGRHRVQAELSI